MHSEGGHSTRPGPPRGPRGGPCRRARRYRGAVAGDPGRRRGRARTPRPRRRARLTRAVGAATLARTRRAGARVAQECREPLRDRVPRPRPGARRRRRRGPRPRGSRSGRRASREVRLTITPNAIPGPRGPTLAAPPAPPPHAGGRCPDAPGGARRRQRGDAGRSPGTPGGTRLGTRVPSAAGRPPRDGRRARRRGARRHERASATASAASGATAPSTAGQRVASRPGARRRCARSRVLSGRRSAPGAAAPDAGRSWTTASRPWSGRPSRPMRPPDAVAAPGAVAVVAGPGRRRAGARSPGRARRAPRPAARADHPARAARRPRPRGPAPPGRARGRRARRPPRVPASAGRRGRTRARSRGAPSTSGAPSRTSRATRRRRPWTPSARPSAPTTSSGTAWTGREAQADPRHVAARPRTASTRTFRAASDRAGSPDETEDAARAWLNEINQLNAAVREAQRTVEAGSAELRARSCRRWSGSSAEADAARIAAENAEAGCREAREALAACEEAEARAREAPARPTPRSPHPFAGVWPDDRPDLPDDPRLRRRPTRWTGVVGDRPDPARRPRRPRALVATLAAGDPRGGARVAAPRRPPGRRDRRAGRSRTATSTSPRTTRSGGCSTQREVRDIVGALSALGFRYDGLGGFADGRVPAARDLSLAVGYAGLDRMRIRTWPRDSEIARALRAGGGRRGRVAGGPGRRPVAGPDGGRARRTRRRPRRRLERLGPGPAGAPASAP